MNEDFKILPLKVDSAYKKYVPLVFAINDEYCKYFAAELKSIIEYSNSTSFYDVVILAESISKHYQKYLEDMLPKNFSIRIFKIHEYCVKVFKKNFQEYKIWSKEIYYKLAVPTLFSEYEKVIFLDADMICLDDVGKLIDEEFHDEQIMAVSDVLNICNIFDLEQVEFNKNILKLSDKHIYFNSGLVVFNTKKIDLEKYVEQVIKLLEIEKLVCPEQDIFNVVFDCKVKYLDLKWNMQYSVYIYHKNDYNEINKKILSEYDDAFDNPAIIHYTSPIKPWFYPAQELAEYFWKFSRQTVFYEDALFQMFHHEISTLRRFVLSKAAKFE